MEKRKSSGGRNSTGERKPFKKDGDKEFGGGGGRRSMQRTPRMNIPKGTVIDYKNIAFLQKCLTERGKLFSSRLTSASAKQQRLLTTAVKRARFLGLISVGSARRK